MPASHPDEPASPTPESLFAGWLAQRELGQEADLDALCCGHPQMAGRLRELRARFEDLEGIRRRFGLAGSLSQRLGSLHGSQVDPRVEIQSEGASDSTAQFLQRLSHRVPASSRYRLKGEIASGGMGAILRVWDEDLRRHLAMKVVLGHGEAAGPTSTPPVDGRTLARFLEEAQVTGQLDHPGIVPVHELGLDAQGRVFFTMKLVQGRDLRAVFDLARRGEEGWTQVKVLGVLHKVCEAMSFAHDKGVVHRDLKPANVMVGRYGEVYVMDWGLAKIVGREDSRDVRIDERELEPPARVSSDRLESDADSPLRTMDGDVLGTPAYMPPEQALGQHASIGPRSDVYAVGAMLYHLLAGHMPYVREGERITHRELLRRLRQGPPPRLDDIAHDRPRELVAICDKAMSRDPQARYPDMAALGDDVAAFLEGRVVRAYEAGTWAEARKWVRRNRGWAASLAAALTIVLGLSAFYAESVSARNRALLEEQGQTAAANEKLKAAVASLQEETERATRATREARANLASALAREATIAGTRGRWPEVLDLLRQARETGYPDEIGLQMEEAWAQVALLRWDRAREILDPLSERNDLGAHLGRVLLLRGDLALRDPFRMEEALALLREAQEASLGNADRAYLRGLLADSTADALAAFEETLSLDPFHFRALGQALQIEALLGRTEEAAQRERAYRELCPSDPMPDAVAALVAGLRGDASRAQGLVVEVTGKAGEEVGQAMQDLVAFGLDLSEGCTLERLIGVGDGTIVAQNALGKTKTLKRLLPRIPLDALMMPSVRSSLATAAEAVTSLAFSQFSTPEKIRERLENAYRRHPDGAFVYLMGDLEMLSPGSSAAELLDKTRRAEVHYARAAQLTSVFPDVQRAARSRAAYAQILLSIGSGDPQGSYRPALTRNVFELCAAPEQLEAELSLLAGQMLNGFDDPTLALTLVRRWQELGPTHPGYPLTLARALIQVGAFERAVKVLDEVLAEDSWNEEAGRLRDEAIAGARASLARIE